MLWCEREVPVEAPICLSNTNCQEATYVGDLARLGYSEGCSSLGRRARQGVDLPCAFLGETGVGIPKQSDLATTKREGEEMIPPPPRLVCIHKVITSYDFRKPKQTGGLHECFM